MSGPRDQNRHHHQLHFAKEGFSFFNFFPSFFLIFGTHSGPSISSASISVADFFFIFFLTANNSIFTSYFPVNFSIFFFFLLLLSRCVRSCWLCGLFFFRTPFPKILLLRFFFSNFRPLSLVEQHILLIIFFNNPPKFFPLSLSPSLSSANSLQPAKNPALALHWGERGRRKKKQKKKKKLVQEIFFFTFKSCAKFMMRVQNGNYQAVCLPLAVVWCFFSVVISVCFQFVVEM